MRASGYHNIILLNEFNKFSNEPTQIKFSIIKDLSKKISFL